MNAPWLTYGCTRVLDVIVFCVGDGNNLVKNGDEKDEGNENQIVDDGDNRGIDDGDTNYNNADAND